VYFDVAGLDAKDNHFYAELFPKAFGDQNQLQEGRVI
jgi:hypothetical protein